MKAYNVDWDFDIEEVFEVLDYSKNEKSAEFLCIPVEKYNVMTNEERHDYAYSSFHHCPAMLDEFMSEFMGVPEEIEIPSELSDEDDIADWISDTYGFCIKGFEIKE